MTNAEIDALISERRCRQCGEEYEDEHVCKSVKDKAQTFALNTWLSDYPSSMTYEQIVYALEKEDDTEGIVERLVIDGVWGELIADLIRETFKRAMGLIGEVQRG
jgi:hypothetical protein